MQRTDVPRVRWSTFIITRRLRRRHGPVSSSSSTSRQPRVNHGVAMCSARTLCSDTQAIGCRLHGPEHNYPARRSIRSRRRSRHGFRGNKHLLHSTTCTAARDLFDGTRVSGILVTALSCSSRAEQLEDVARTFLIRMRDAAMGEHIAW